MADGALDRRPAGRLAFVGTFDTAEHIIASMGCDAASVAPHDGGPFLSHLENLE